MLRAPALGLVVLGSVLSGCAAGLTVPETPAADSTACRSALAAAPATVLDGARHDSGYPGAPAWGEPAVIVWCGLADSGPSTKPCVNVNGIDWLQLADGDLIRFDTFGRSPGLAVVVPPAAGRNPVDALVDLAPMAQALPATGHACS